MTRVYVITGFLGSGKTTFLKEFARLLSGEKLAILVNEFGREDIDGKLLKELHAAMEEVHSGSIFCACRAEQFSDALSRLLKESPDTVLVETSGLSDPTRIRALLSEHPMASRIEFRGCLCIVDAVRFQKVYSTAVVCGRQLDACDAVILNKTDLADEEQKRRTLGLIYDRRPGIPVFEASYGKIQGDWLRLLNRLPLTEGGFSAHIKDVSLQSRLISIRDTFPKDELLAFLGRIAFASYRIKGFARLREGTFLVDVVGDQIKLHDWDEAVENPNRLVVLTGQGLPLASSLKEAAGDYSEYILSVE